MSIKNIRAIFKKQVKDIFKNKVILLQFILFPVLAVIMNESMEIEGMPQNFWVKIFGTMYIGMAPLVNMSTIISEEKEENTLKALLMANVKPLEYLIGVGSIVWFICMIGASVFGIIGEYSGKTLVYFLMIMAVGILISIMIGAVIGGGSKNQLVATSITVPLMMLLSFLPMLAMFNEGIAKIAGVAYSQQISLLIDDVEQMNFTAESIIVILATFLVASLVFKRVYKKSNLI